MDLKQLYAKKLIILIYRFFAPQFVQNKSSATILAPQFVQKSDVVVVTGSSSTSLGNISVVSASSDETSRI